MVRTLFRPSSKKSTAKGVVFQNIVSYLEVVLKGHLILCFTNSGLQLSLSGSRLGFYKIEDGIKKHQRAGSEALCCFKDTYCSVTVDRGPTTRPFSWQKPLAKALSLSVSYSETFCAFLFLLPFQKENKEPPTTPLHGPQGPTHPALAFLWLHAIEFSWVHPKSLKVHSLSGILHPCPFHLLTPIYLSWFCSNITFSQKPHIPRLGQACKLHTLRAHWTFSYKHLSQQ